MHGLFDFLSSIAGAVFVGKESFGTARDYVNLQPDIAAAGLVVMTVDIVIYVIIAVWIRKNT